MGFGIRFTVHFNLFCGSVLQLCTSTHEEKLQEINARGELGCFMLTERSSGVLSGLIVDTVCRYDEASNEFILHTPNPGAAKVWVTQGCVAEHAVVIADLTVGGVSHGPHAFLVTIRDEGGKLLAGIKVESMARKTVANDLDNATVEFDNVRLPVTALLNRGCDVVGGAYDCRGKKMTIHTIGARLLGGRVAISEIAISLAASVYRRAGEYAREKRCRRFGGQETTLAELPHYKMAVASVQADLMKVSRYVSGVERELSQFGLGVLPGRDTFTRVAVAKIHAVERSLLHVQQISSTVGSYSILDTGGVSISAAESILLMCRFAEGDTNVLRVKLAGDEIREFMKGGIIWGALKGALSDEGYLSLRLAYAFRTGGINCVVDDNWRDVMLLAKTVIDREVNS
jgi:acyl-CoA oxidase